MIVIDVKSSARSPSVDRRSEASCTATALRGKHDFKIVDGDPIPANEMALPVRPLIPFVVRGRRFGLAGLTPRLPNNSPDSRAKLAKRFRHPASCAELDIWWRLRHVSAMTAHRPGGLKGVGSLMKAAFTTPVFHNPIVLGECRLASLHPGNVWPWSSATGAARVTETA